VGIFLKEKGNFIMAYSLEEKFKKGELSHLMELEMLNVPLKDTRLYRCGACGLAIVAFNLRDARRIAEDKYGRCKYWRYPN
jgi:hypothetical protein